MKTTITMLDGIELTQDQAKCVIKSLDSDAHVLTREMLFMAASSEVSKRELIPIEWMLEMKRLIDIEPSRARYVNALCDSYEKEDLRIYTTPELAAMYEDELCDTTIKVTTATANGGTTTIYINKAA